MKKSKNWLEIPIIYHEYPKHIRDLAEKAGVDVELVAESKDIQPGQVLIEYYRRDLIEKLERISADPDDPEACIFSYVDNSYDQVKWPASKAVKKIDEFLGDSYIFHHRAEIYYQQIQQQQYENDEEREEME